MFHDELPDREYFLQTGLVPAKSAQISVADNTCDHCWEPADFEENETFRGSIVTLECCNTKNLYKVYHRQCILDYFNQLVQGYHQNCCPNKECGEQLYKKTKASRGHRTGSFRGMIRSFSNSFGSLKAREVNPGSVSSSSRMPSSRPPSSRKDTSRAAPDILPPPLKGKKRIDSARAYPDRGPVLICIIKSVDIASVLEDGKRKGIVPQFVGYRIQKPWEVSLKRSLSPYQGKSMLVKELKHLVYNSLNNVLIEEMRQYPHAWHGKGDDHTKWVKTLTQFIGISISDTMSEHGPLDIHATSKYWNGISFPA